MNEFTKYAKDLARAASGIDRKAERAVEKVGKGALGTAKSIAPDDEGDLERSLTFRRDGTRAIVESDLYYARFQEYGTSQMAPNPFMGPASEIWTPRLVAEVEGIADDVAKELS